MWIDSSIQNRRLAFIDGLSTELENPFEKMIILHVRPEFGFVDGRLLVFHGIKSTDYQEEINAKYLKNDAVEAKLFKFQIVKTLTHKNFDVEKNK
ncbi:hypothetical protein NQ317_013556 [Molorchus minor]|uniref:Uncharacterized protein n=1 Tax=Molorchus minor TaxID=1323400 RepID=A0ABQ9JJ94_9CUCU|nr:hypothetical protein NQ317_013556 [Molorchus minor]